MEEASRRLAQAGQGFLNPPVAPSPLREYEMKESGARRRFCCPCLFAAQAITVVRGVKGGREK